MTRIHSQWSRWSEPVFAPAVLHLCYHATMANIFPEAWKSLSPSEVAAVVFQTYGHSQLTSDGNIAIPSNGPDEALQIVFRNGAIEAINTGPSYEEIKWREALKRVEEELISNQQAISGCDVTFSPFPVPGFWRSEQLGIQIRPVPQSAPRPDFAIGEHPFLIDFPTVSSSSTIVAHRRRAKVARDLALILNLLITGHVELISRQVGFVWAYVRDGDTSSSQYVQTGYDIGPGFLPFSDTLPDVSGEPLELIAHGEYCDDLTKGIEVGRPLILPISLEESLLRWLALEGENRERFVRALYWLNVSRQQWSTAHSLFLFSTRYSD